MGTYTEPSKKTLAQYAPEALERRRITGKGLKATTAASYRRYVIYDIVPSRLGEMKLTDIRRAHVNAWVAELKAERGAVTVRRALATLQMVFSTAVRDEIIPISPAAKVDKPMVPESAVTHWWEPEQIREFIDRSGRHRLGPLLELAVHTGMRRGEITGLHWDDVDLADRTIVVRHNRVTVEGRVQETTTKTRSGRRTLPLSDAAVAALLTWQLRQSDLHRSHGRRSGASPWPNGKARVAPPLVRSRPLAPRDPQPPDVPNPGCFVRDRLAIRSHRSGIRSL